MNNQSGPDGCTEQTSGLDLLVGPPRAQFVRMGAPCARARGALHAHVYSIQIRVPYSSPYQKHNSPWGFRTRYSMYRKFVG